jgi:hypothetical protein
MFSDVGLSSLGPYSSKASLKMKDGIEGKDGMVRNDHGFVLKEQTRFPYPTMNDRTQDAAVTV